MLGLVRPQVPALPCTRLAAALRAALAALAAAAACGAAASPGGTPRAGTAAGEAAAERVQRLIGPARCSSDAQCRVIGIGHRPCGGPERYAAWSTASTPDAQALATAVREHADARQRWHDKQGLMSTCEVLPVPAARCDRSAEGGGRCALVPAREAQR
jgi:hypothetical protein